MQPGFEIFPTIANEGKSKQQQQGCMCNICCWLGKCIARQQLGSNTCRSSLPEVGNSSSYSSRCYFGTTRAKAPCLHDVPKLALRYPRSSAVI